MFCRNNLFHKVKDLECVKRSVYSKWDNILDFLVARDDFDFLFWLIDHCKIPNEKYLNHKGGMMILLLHFQMYLTSNTSRGANDGDSM